MSDGLSEAFYLRQLERQRNQPRTEAERRYLMTKRQTLIMELGAIEDLLGMERSIDGRKRDANTIRL